MALMAPIADLLAKDADTLRSALSQLDRAGSGFLIVVDHDGVLAGVLTDGDVRRALMRGVTLDEPVSTAVRADCVSLPIEADDIRIQQTLNQRIAFVPLLDASRRPVDYASHRRLRRFPVLEPDLGGNEALYLQECVQSGWISSQGR